MVFTISACDGPGGRISGQNPLPRRLRSSPWLSVPACFAIARRIAMFTASYRPLSLCAALAIALAVASWAPIAAHSTSLLPHFALERPTAECQPSGCPTTGSLAHNPVPPSWRVMVVPALPASTARTYIHLLLELFFRPAMTLNSPGIHHCPCLSRSPHVIVMCALYPLFAIMVVRAPPPCCAMDMVSSFGTHLALLRG